MKTKLAKKIGAMVGATILSASTNVYALGEADNVWLKLVYKTKAGQQIDEATGGISKGRSKGTCFTQLIYTPNIDPLMPGTYAGDIICENSLGAFVSTGSSINLNELPGGDAAFAEGDVTEYSNSDEPTVRGRGNGLLILKKDKAGAFKKATYKTLASALDGASLDGGATTLIGGLSVKGKSIDETKLPF